MESEQAKRRPASDFYTDPTMAFTANKRIRGATGYSPSFSSRAPPLSRPPPFPIGNQGSPTRWPAQAGFPQDTPSNNLASAHIFRGLSPMGYAGISGSHSVSEGGKGQHFSGGRGGHFRNNASAQSNIGSYFSESMPQDPTSCPARQGFPQDTPNNNLASAYIFRGQSPIGYAGRSGSHSVSEGGRGQHFSGGRGGHFRNKASAQSNIGSYFSESMLQNPTSCPARQGFSHDTPSNNLASAHIVKGHSPMGFAGRSGSYSVAEGGRGQHFSGGRGGHFRNKASVQSNIGSYFSESMLQDPWCDLQPVVGNILVPRTDSLISLSLILCFRLTSSKEKQRI